LLLATLVVSFFHANQSLAEVPDATMINTLQCEAGRVALQMAKAGLAIDRKVTVSWTHTNTVNREGGIGLTFPVFSFGGSGDMSKEEVDELKSEGQQFNLHPDNYEKVCKVIKREIIKEGIGLYDCLVAKKFPTLKNSLSQGTGTASCKKRVTLSKKLKGNLRLQVWGIDVGPSGSWGDIEVYEIAVAAPDHPKAK